MLAQQIFIFETLQEMIWLPVSVKVLFLPSLGWIFAGVVGGKLCWQSFGQAHNSANKLGGGGKNPLFTCCHHSWLLKIS